MSEVAVRPCTVQDAEAVESLRVEGWRTAYRGMIPDPFLDSMPVDAERRRGHIAQRPDGVLESVAVQDGTIVGWVAAGPCRDEDRREPGQGEIYACYVLPRRWRSGIGQLLMSQAMAALAAAGRDDISLWVLEANSAARWFYESCGFQPDGARQLLDLGGPVPEIRYRRKGTS
jgi:ribosomal protein S18 acetylase RimI-like enzyme